MVKYRCGIPDIGVVLLCLEQPTLRNMSGQLRPVISYPSFGWPLFQLFFSVSEPNLKLRSRLKQKQERRNSPLMARKSPGNEVLTERIRRKISTNSMGEKNEINEHEM